MHNLEVDLKKLARKTKVKRWLTMSMISVVVVFFILIGGYKLTQYFTSKQYWQLNYRFEKQESIVSPNIQSATRQIGLSNVMGGTIVSQRYKDINGYVIPWDQKEGTYTWTRSSERMPGSNYGWVDNKRVNSLNGQKIPIFYNVKLENNHYEKNELQTIGEMNNYLGEVALTFDQAYSYEEINKMLPENVLLNWLWLGTKTDYDVASQFTFIGVNTNKGELSEDSYQRFAKTAAKATTDLGKMITHTVNENGDDISYEVYGDAENAIKGNEDLATAKFAGVIITGEMKNLYPLRNESWIYASSMGATVEKLPYLKPLK